MLKKTNNQATQVNASKNNQMTTKMTGTLITATKSSNRIGNTNDIKASGSNNQITSNANNSLDSSLMNGSVFKSNKLANGKNHMILASKRMLNQTDDDEKLSSVNNNGHKDQSEQTDLLNDVDMESNSKYLKNLNETITCALCSGYLINATTIIDCLDTFCRSCIVNYLETSNSCPICDTPLNKIKPHQSLRPDIVKQTMLYKIAPQVFFDEMSRRQIFYKNEDFTAVNKEDAGLLPAYSYFRPNDRISMSLEYLDGPLIEKDSDDKKSKKKTGKSMATKNILTNNKSSCLITPETSKKLENEDIIFVNLKKRPSCRYLNCPAALPILQLKKLIFTKFEGMEMLKGYNIEIFYSGHLLKNEFTLMEVAYAYNWGANDPMRFTYCFVKIKPKNQPEAIENSLEESSVSTQKSSTRNFRSTAPSSSLSTNKSFNTRSSSARGNSSVSTNTINSNHKTTDKINLNMPCSSKSITSNSFEQISKVSDPKITSNSTNSSLVSSANSINDENAKRKKAKLDHLEIVHTTVHSSSSNTPAKVSWPKSSSSSSISVSRTKNDDYITKPINSIAKSNVTISGNKRPLDKNDVDDNLPTPSNNLKIIKLSPRTIPKSSSLSISTNSPTLVTSQSFKKDSNNHNQPQKNQMTFSSQQKLSYNNNSQSDTKKTSSTGQKQLSSGQSLSPPSIRIKLTTSPNSSPSQLFGQIISPIPPEVQNERSQSSKNDVSSSSISNQTQKNNNDDENDKSNNNNKNNNLQISNSDISVNITANATKSNTNTNTTTAPQGYKMVTSQGVQSCTTITDSSSSSADNTNVANEALKPRGKLIHDIINKMTSKSNFKTSCLKSFTNGIISGQHQSSNNKPNNESSSLEELINANKSTIPDDSQQLSTNATKSSGNLVIRISTKSLESKKIQSTEKLPNNDNSGEKLEESSSEQTSLENIESKSQCSHTSKTISSPVSSPQLNIVDDDDDSNEPKLVVDIDREDDQSDSDSSRLLIVEETDQSEIDSGRGSSNGSEINYAKTNESAITDCREVVSSSCNKSPILSPPLTKPVNASPLSISSILSSTTSSTNSPKLNFSGDITKTVPVTKSTVASSNTNKPFLAPLDLSSKKRLQPAKLAVENIVSTVSTANKAKSSTISIPFPRKSLASKIVPPLPQQIQHKPFVSSMPIIPKIANASGISVSNNFSRVNNKTFIRNNNNNNNTPISYRMIGANNGNISNASVNGPTGYGRASSTNWNAMLSQYSNLNNTNSLQAINQMISNNNLALAMMFNQKSNNNNNNNQSNESQMKQKTILNTSLNRNNSLSNNPVKNIFIHSKNNGLKWKI